LISIKPDINISVNDEYVFITACQNGRLKFAQWLLQLNPDIDISANSEDAFVDACRNNCLSVAKWFVNLNPYVYKLDIEDDIIIDFHVMHSILDKILHKKQNIVFVEECGICLESISEIKINCGHSFCKSCLSKYLNEYSKTDCPYCREIITDCYH